VPSEPIALTPGLTAAVAGTVTEATTASGVGSGDVAVLATPEVAALAERAAVRAVAGRVPAGQTSVGTSISVEHLAPTPIGATVRATARLESVDGRRLTFSFAVTDPAGEVARGTHGRVIVDRARFEASAAERIPPG